MKNFLRIRKNFPGAVDRFVVCTESGRPMYTWRDLKEKKKGIANIIALNPDTQIEEELHKYPDVDVFSGDTNLEKLQQALLLWENESRRNSIVFGYIRVSTTTQAREGNSLQSQRDALTAAGAERIFEDVYTGTAVDRPQLQNLMRYLRPGDTIVVTKLDRIARSVSQGADLIEALIKRGIKVKILAMGDNALDDSPTGRLIRHIFLSFAEFERDLIVQRTQEGKAVARATNPDFKEGRPKKYSKVQRDHAMDLLQTHSYHQVSKMTGISVSTLTREHKKHLQSC